jgi:hypothetical protein
MASTLHVSPLQRERAKHAAEGSTFGTQAMLREALEIGLLVLLAGSSARQGHYADLSAEELADRLRPRMIQVLDLLHQQGRTPALLTPLPSSAVPYQNGTPPAPPAPVDHTAAVTDPTPPTAEFDPPAEGPAPAATTSANDAFLAELLEAGCVLLEA